MKKFNLVSVLSIALGLLFSPFSYAAPEQDSLKTVINNLDLPLRYVMSETIGKDNSSFHITKAGETYHAVNGNVSVSMGRRGMDVSYNGHRWKVGLASLQGRAFLPKTETVAANRAEFVAGAVPEWHVNGPLGVQQGWTIKERPAREGTGIILDLASEGSLQPVVAENGRGLNLLDNNGATRLSYGGLYAYDARGDSLPVAFEMNGKALRISLDDANAVYPVVVDPVVYTQMAQLAASDAAGWDYLGLSVAVSADGGTVAAGAPYYSRGGAMYIGAVYVFVKGSAWSNRTQTAKLIAATETDDNNLGYSVAISGDGNTVIAGAPGGTSYNGRVYVFEKGAQGWTDGTETALLTSSGGPAIDRLGYSVSISADGSTIAGGAYNANAGGYDHAGALYVFEKGTGWTTRTQTARLRASDGTTNSYLGWSVAVNEDGSTIAGGAPTSGSEGPGAIYVFERGAGWVDGVHTAKLTASGGVLGDMLGSSVSLSSDGRTLAAGAYYATIGETMYVGAVYVFEKGTVWSQAGKLTASVTTSDNLLGISVAITPDGTTIAAGAIGDDGAANSSATYAGAVYVFKKGSGWANGTETAKLAASDAAKDNYFGRAVGISTDGNTIAVGAFGALNNVGAAYIFGPNVEPSTETVYGSFPGYGLWVWNGSSWSQLTPDTPQNMAASGSTLYGDFGTLGLWKYNGISWSQLTPDNPENIAASGSALYGDFGALGLWKYDGSAWSQLTPDNPQTIAVSGSTLYGSFGALGLWKYNGTNWSWLTSDNPQNMAASGSILYGDFGALGLWKYNGTSWSLLTPDNPENIAASGSILYGDFGTLGLWKYDGTNWSLLTPDNPENIAASGTTLYGDFGTLGLWKYDGSNWSMLTSDNPSLLITN